MREKYTACAGIIQSAITSSEAAAGSFYGHFSERFIATRAARRTAMRGARYGSGPRRQRQPVRDVRFMRNRQKARL